jgi:heme/copper-type cytochrome/quinol oxidase subunit 2
MRESWCGRAWRRGGRLLCALVLALGCEKLPPVPELLQVRVLGEGYEWLVQYPGPDALLDTADDVRAKQNLRLPEHTRVQIEVRSSDYIYGFRIPGLGVNEMAVPELVFVADFETPEPSVHALKGDQMCGYAHPRLIGHVIIEPKRQFQRWQVQQGIDS